MKLNKLIEILTKIKDESSTSEFIDVSVKLNEYDDVITDVLEVEFIPLCGDGVILIV